MHWGVQDNPGAGGGFGGPIDAPPPTGLRRRGGRYRRAGGWFALGVFVLAAVLLPVGAVVAWQAYTRSNAAQAGPAVPAQVLGVTTSSTSSRSGTTWTSHYRVVFTGPDGRTVRATVRANGKDPCACAVTQVRYDPGDPTDVELAGAPNGSLAGAVALTVLAVFVLALAAFLLLLATPVGRARLARRAGRAVCPACGAPRGLPSPGCGSCQDRLSRRRRRALRSVGVGTLTGVALAGGLIAYAATHANNSGPSWRYFLANIRAAAAGRGTAGCLDLPPAVAQPGPETAGFGTAAAATGMSSDGTPASGWWVRTSEDLSALGPGLAPLWRSLGGTVPAPGDRSPHATSWTGAFPAVGARGVDVWTLASPAAAARWRDIEVASQCYGHAWGKPGRVARLLANTSAAPPQTATVAVDSGPGSVAEVFADTNAGRYELEADVVVGPGREAAGAAQVDAMLAAAVASGR